MLTTSNLTFKVLIRILIMVMAMMLFVRLFPDQDVHARPEVPHTVIEVTTGDDEFDSSGGSIDCSLREAIQSANLDSDFGGCVRSGSGTLAIIIPAGTYSLTLPGSDEDNNASGDLDIRVAVTLYGAGVGTTIIQAQVGLNDRVFHIVRDDASDFVAMMWDMTITGGHLVNGSGGGILNEESLWVSRVSILYNYAHEHGGGVASNPAHAIQSFRAYLSSSISLNDAHSGLGGGTYLASGELLFNHVEMAANEAVNGAALYLAGETADIAWTSIHVNKATGDGAGIYLAGGGMTLADSSIYYNSLEGDGGNIYIADSAGASSIERCYIGKGQAPYGLGAGIYNAGALTLSSSTVTLNTGSFAAGIYNAPTVSSGVMLRILDSTVTYNNINAPAGQQGEGLYNAQDLTNIEIRNTIFASNGYPVPAIINCYSANSTRLFSLGHNLDSGDSCGFSLGSDLTDINPLLSDLDYHEGFSPNYTLEPLSPALETGGDCLASDQRGFTRPMDQNRDDVALCDIGATEAEPYTLPPFAWFPLVVKP
jgi:CSLREA domain-containing protein